MTKVSWREQKVVIIPLMKKMVIPRSKRSKRKKRVMMRKKTTKAKVKAKRG
jgi:hypothetical protein